MHNPLKVTDAARVRYVDRMSVADLRRQYPELGSDPLVDVDIIDDGEYLATVSDNSQDFVIANHFVEHSQNPFLAIGNMFRVLKPSGVLYMALPDKRFSFDAERALTTIEHLQRDFQEGPDWSKKDHYRDWARYVDRFEEPAACESHANKLMEMDYSIHFHVWDQKEMMEMVMFLRRMFPFEVEVVLKNRKENIFVLRKVAS